MIAAMEESKTVHRRAFFKTFPPKTPKFHHRLKKWSSLLRGIYFSPSFTFLPITGAQCAVKCWNMTYRKPQIRPRGICLWGMGCP